MESKVEKQRQVKGENQQQVKGDIPSGKGIGFDAKGSGKFSIDLQWLANKDFKVDSTKIYEEIKTSIFGKIDKFDEWLDGECKQNVFDEYKSRGELVKAFFDKAWAECKGDVLAQKLREVLSANKEVLSANKKEGNVLDCDTVTMKILVSEAVRAKLGEEGLGNVVVAEPRLATVKQNKNGYLPQLAGEFQKWKVENFGPVKDILGKKSCAELESAVQKDYDQLRDVIVGKTTLMDLFKSDISETKTFFNHLVTFFANEKKNADKSLFEVIREDLEAKINSYKLVDKEAKNIKPKLTMPSPNANNNDPRVTQDEKTSPQQLIQSLLKKDPKVGLIQKGSLSCWMISVVNGLLATKGGSEILEKCFKDPNQCVFNALTTEGGTKPITVSSEEIAAVMAKNTGVSQLEAAIWKGVDKMADEGGFGVKGCKLGEMGEATDVARLFGLRNAAMGTGRTVTDDNYTWVTGANALRGDKVVVLHARNDNNLNSGHFVTAIGTKFVDKGVKQGLAPEKSFFIQDSLTNWNTQTLNSDDLNVNGTTKDQSRFEVLAYEIPA